MDVFLGFKAIINSIDALRAYKAFSHDVTAAILVFQTIKRRLSYVNAFFCFNKFA